MDAHVFPPVGGARRAFWTAFSMDFSKLSAVMISLFGTCLCGLVVPMLKMLRQTSHTPSRAVGTEAIAARERVPKLLTAEYDKIAFLVTPPALEGVWEVCLSIFNIGTTNPQRHHVVVRTRVWVGFDVSSYKGAILSAVADNCSPRKFFANLWSSKLSVISTTDPIATAPPVASSVLQADQPYEPPYFLSAYLWAYHGHEAYRFHQ
ncbi:hypothetical protein E4U36_000324 [Claviceps purpurea]|nr:hypothetical protein E4U36_000324 [Claviceps purpurea]